MKEEDNVKDMFKHTKEIKAFIGIPKDFKDFFKNATKINELPPMPKNKEKKNENKNNRF